LLLGVVEVLVQVVEQVAVREEVQEDSAQAQG
jgi:hypothetical protein